MFFLFVPVNFLPRHFHDPTHGKQGKRWEAPPTTPAHKCGKSVFVGFDDKESVELMLTTFWWCANWHNLSIEGLYLVHLSFILLQPFYVRQWFTQKVATPCENELSPEKGPCWKEIRSSNNQFCGNMLLVGGWTNPFEKYAGRHGFIFPK